MINKDIVSALGNLINSGHDLSKDTLSAAVTQFKMIDVNLSALNISDKLQKALATKSYNTAHQRLTLTTPAKTKYYDERSCDGTREALLRGDHQSPIYRVADFLYKMRVIDYSHRFNLDNHGPQYQRDVCISVPLSVSVDKQDIKKGIELIVATLEDLASKDLIAATLCPLGLVELQSRYAVVSYVNIAPNMEQQVLQDYAPIAHSESEEIARLEDL